jgi:tetratricopeptide (TPR) repeat protein
MANCISKLKNASSANFYVFQEYEQVMRTWLSLMVFFALVSSVVIAEEQTDTLVLHADSDAVTESVNKLQEPLYNAFTERYILDDLRSLRTEMAAQKAELLQQVMDREHSAIDRAVTYSTDTVTYFFYIVAAASSILVMVGWTSIREVRERVQNFANSEINKLISEYEERLGNLEQQLSLKTQDIEENREEIAQARETQALWLRAQQEIHASGKISIYDQILKISPDDASALTYKADAVLELNEPQWAINLCTQALSMDEENSHAYYQMACAYALMGYPDIAMKNIHQAIEINESYREDLDKEEMLISLHELEEFRNLWHIEGN